MTDAGYVTVYANTIAVMLSLGILVLAGRLRIKDRTEKRIFMSLLTNVIAMSIFYILRTLRDDRVIVFTQATAMLLETILEILINLFTIIWMIYVDYRMFHSMTHIKRNAAVIFIPFLVLIVLDVINSFTGIMLRIDENLVVEERPLYILTDIIRIGYFIVSLVILEVHKRRDENMKFFSVLPFFVPTLFYILFYYFTPYATVTLGLSIGIALIYVELINEQCYKDSETGFYNILYLDYLRKKAAGGRYDPQSAIVFRISGDSIKQSAEMIAKQLPRNCYTIRCSKDTLVTLAYVKNKSSLFMISEDVQTDMDKAGIPIQIGIDQKKKTERGIVFLDRLLKSV